MSVITDVSGIKVGHYTTTSGVSGCTVVLCPQGTRGSVDVRGAAPGTRETDLLTAGRLVSEVHAVLLTGGSAFGLAAADGVMTFLEEQRIGFMVGETVVPIVPAAVVFDLGALRKTDRIDSQAGYEACAAAGLEVEEGSVGAGAGATVGKYLGMDRAMMGGVGTCSARVDDAVVGVLAVVNAVGDVIDEQGRVLAGARDSSGKLAGFDAATVVHCARRTNTVLVVVATDASYSRDELSLLASVGHDGIARSVYPAHTWFDGDTVFVVSTGKVPGMRRVVGEAAVARLVEKAIRRAVYAATSKEGLPAMGSSDQ